MRKDIEPLAVTVRQAGQMIGCSRSTIYSLIGEGRLEALKLGVATRITTESIRALIATAPRKTAA
jgi:excisionase family DNA binding protein